LSSVRTLADVSYLQSMTNCNAVQDLTHFLSITLCSSIAFGNTLLSTSVIPVFDNLGCFSATLMHRVE